MASPFSSFVEAFKLKNNEDLQQDRVALLAFHPCEQFAKENGLDATQPWASFSGNIAAALRLLISWAECLRLNIWDAACEDLEDHGDFCKEVIGVDVRQAAVMFLKRCGFSTPEIRCRCQKCREKCREDYGRLLSKRLPQVLLQDSFFTMGSLSITGGWHLLQKDGVVRPSPYLLFFLLDHAGCDRALLERLDIDIVRNDFSLLKEFPGLYELFPALQRDVGVAKSLVTLDPSLWYGLASLLREDVGVMVAAMESQSAREGPLLAGMIMELADAVSSLERMSSRQRSRMLQLAKAFAADPPDPAEIFALCGKLLAFLDRRRCLEDVSAPRRAEAPCSIPSLLAAEHGAGAPSGDAASVEAEVRAANDAASRAKLANARRCRPHQRTCKKSIGKQASCSEVERSEAEARAAPGRAEGASSFAAPHSVKAPGKADSAPQRAFSRRGWLCL